MSEGLAGLKVVVTFDTTRWPIHKATYVYEGFDETGHFLRRKDGVQRHMLFEDVQGIELAGDQEIPEGEY